MTLGTTLGLPKAFYPVQHPEYQYPVSRNPYWEKLHHLKGLVFLDQESERHQGKWRSFFSGFDASDTRRPIHLEIGCNAGHVIVEQARINPHTIHIGIDWKFKAIFRAAEKAKRNELRNTILVRAYAERLRFIFSPGEIDQINLFFPDPWPKKAHWKNRLVTASRLKEFGTLIHPGGLLHIKTDHPGYFDWMMEVIDSCQKENPGLWRLQETNRNLHSNQIAPENLKIPEVTLFEKLFIKQGIPIHQIKLARL